MHLSFEGEFVNSSTSQTGGMCTGNLFEARSPPVPRAHWATPTLVRQEHSSAAGPCAETAGPALGRLGCQGGRGHRPGGAVPKPQPPPFRARKEAAVEEGATEVPECASPAGGQVPVFYPRGEGLRGEDADSPILPARRPPRSFHRAVAANQSPGAGARAHRGLSNSRPALLLALLLPTGAGPGPGARRLSPTPPQLPDALAERAVTAGREGGRGAARLLGPGARVAPEPPAPRAGTQCSAPRPARLVSLGARAAEDAGGLPRPGPALLPRRAPGALLAAPRPRRQRGREGGIRPRRARQPRKPQPQGRAPRIFQSPSPPPSYCGQAPVDAERQPRASAWIPGLTTGEPRCGRGPWRWRGGAAPRGADPGRAKPPAPPA